MDLQSLELGAMNLMAEMQKKLTIEMWKKLGTGWTLSIVSCEISEEYEYKYEIENGNDYDELEEIVSHNVAIKLRSINYSYLLFYLRNEGVLHVLFCIQQYTHASVFFNSSLMLLCFFCFEGTCNVFLNSVFIIFKECPR